VPVTVTVLDVFGYVARVEGASMQVSACGKMRSCGCKKTGRQTTS